MRIPTSSRVGLRHRPTSLAAILLALGIPLRLGASAAGAEPLSLPAVIEEAKASNPELKAARGRARAMAAMPTQVSALDDPTVSYEAWDTPESFRLDRASNNIFRVSQRFPFPGKRRLAGEVARNEAEQSRLEGDAVERDLVAGVKRAYYDLWQAHERLSVLMRQKGVLERFSRTAEQKYATGAATQPDVLRAQVELTHLINELQTERLNVSSLEAELRSMLSRDGSEPLGIPEDPATPVLTLPASELEQLALTKRPELAAQNAAIGRGQAAVALAQRGYYPDFEVSIARFQNFGARDGFGAMASVTVPIFNGAKYDAGVSEADARLDVARSERRRLEDRVRREVEQAYLAAKKSLLQHELFARTHIPQAEQALRVTESSYEAGTVSFLDLLDTVRSLEAVHLEHIAAQAEFEKAYAELERVVGTELPRSGPGRSNRGKVEHHG